MRPRPLPWTAQCSGSPSLQSLLPFSSLGRQSGYLERPTFLQQSSMQREKSIYPCIDASSGLFPGLTFTCPTCLGLSTALYPSIPGRKILLTYQCCLVPGSNTHWSPQTHQATQLAHLHLTTRTRQQHTFRANPHLICYGLLDQRRRSRY